MQIIKDMFSNQTGIPYKPEGSLINTEENRYYFSNVSTLAEAMLKGRILEGRAELCDSAHNLIVDLGCMKGKILREQTAVGIEDGSTRDIAIISRVNKPICFYITEIINTIGEEPFAMLSRRKVQQEALDRYISKLEPGDIIDGKITHLENFGAFVDIACGICSLLPIDCISVSRISHPSDRFRSGQTIKAIVRSIDELGRVCLSHKELLGTWEENAQLFRSSETVPGIIRSVENYGVFVELTPNLAGLAENFPGASPGQSASVFIKSLIPQKMKVKLIIVDAFDEDSSILPAFNYRISSGRLSYFKYSPDCCDKIMETIFQ